MNFKYDNNNKYHRLGKNILVVLASLIIFVELWWFIAELIDSRVLPTPPETFAALKDFLANGYLNISAWDYISSSLVLFLKGFLLAFVVAVPLGLVLGFSKTLNTFVTPIVEVLRPIAPMAWAPIFIYGISYGTGPILVVFIGIFFPLLTNIIFGVKKIDPTLVDAARTLGANKMQVFTKVMAPSSIPYVMNGIKVGLGVGWMCIVASELYAASGGGIGYFVGLQASLGFWPNVYAGIFVIAILGILTTSLFDYIYKIITKRMGME